MSFKRFVSVSFRSPAVWTSGFYALAALPYAHLARVDHSAMAGVVAVSLVLLAAGSWAFHALSAHGWIHRPANFVDHVAMHVSFGTLAILHMKTSFWESVVVAACMMWFSRTVLPKRASDPVCRPYSYAAIGAYGLLAVLAMAETSPLGAAVAGTLFATSFYFRGADPLGVGGFGPRHAVWHLWTALAFAAAAPGVL